MKIYQLKAQGPLALNNQAMMVYFSRECFLKREDADNFTDEFATRVMTPTDANDVSYLAQESLIVKVVELTLQGELEPPKPVPEPVKSDVPPEPPPLVPEPTKAEAQFVFVPTRETEEPVAEAASVETPETVEPVKELRRGRKTQRLEPPEQV